MKEGSPNKERGGCIGAGSLQSQPGANLHPNTANKRVRVTKGGEADGVALTPPPRPKVDIIPIPPRFIIPVVSIILAYVADLIV